jgi:flagellar biosynthetic protein FlhB
MSDDADADDKTEDASPERLRNAREEGQFPRSKDAQAVGASLAVLVALIMMRDQYGAVLTEFARKSFSEPYGLIRGGVADVAGDVGAALLILVLPPVLLAVIVSIAIGLAEAGFHPNLDLAMPKWSRIDPAAHLGQLFSLKSHAVTGLLMMGRVGVIGYVSYILLLDAFPLLARLTRAELGAAVVEVLTVAARFALWATFALLVMAAIDYAYSYHQHYKKLRMTKQEVKDEHMQQEGDPRVKAQQRARARENLRRGLMKEMKRADVVLANPTHISIALRYRASEGAPVVIAKGYDEIALYIRKLAKDNAVPVIENKPLARALAKRVRVGKSIPVEMYAAVAEVLAFVYRLKHARGQRPVARISQQQRA